MILFDFERMRNVGRRKGLFTEHKTVLGFDLHILILLCVTGLNYCCAHSWQSSPRLGGIVWLYNPRDGRLSSRPPPPEVPKLRLLIFPILPQSAGFKKGHSYELIHITLSSLTSIHPNDIAIVSYKLHTTHHKMSFSLARMTRTSLSMKSSLFKTNLTLRSLSTRATTYKLNNGISIPALGFGTFQDPGSQ